MQKPIALLTGTAMLVVAGVVVSQKIGFDPLSNLQLRGTLAPPVPAACVSSGCACPTATSPSSGGPIVPNCYTGFTGTCNAAACTQKYQNGRCVYQNIPPDPAWCFEQDVTCPNSNTACQWHKCVNNSLNPKCDCQTGSSCSGGRTVNGTPYSDLLSCISACNVYNSSTSSSTSSSTASFPSTSSSRSSSSASACLPIGGYCGTNNAACCSNTCTLQYCGNPPPVTGACCGMPNLKCTDGVTQSSCPTGSTTAFYSAKTCSYVYTLIDPRCPEPKGACCAGTTTPAMCTQDVTQANCKANPNRAWHEGVTCGNAGITDTSCNAVCNNKINPDPAADSYGYRGWVAKPTSYPSTIDGTVVNNVTDFWAALDASAIKNAKAACAALPIPNCDTGCTDDTMGGTIPNGVEVTFTPNIGPQNIPDNGNIFSLANIGAKPTPTINFGGREVKGKCQKIRHCKQSI